MPSETFVRLFQLVMDAKEGPDEKLKAEVYRLFDALSDPTEREKARDYLELLANVQARDPEAD